MQARLRRVHYDSPMVGSKERNTYTPEEVVAAFKEAACHRVNKKRKMLWVFSQEHEREGPLKYLSYLQEERSLLDLDAEELKKLNEMLLKSPLCKHPVGLSLYYHIGGKIDGLENEEIDPEEIENLQRILGKIWRWWGDTPSGERFGDYLLGLIEGLCLKYGRENLLFRAHLERSKSER